MALPLVALLLRGPLAQLHVAAKQWAGQAAGGTLARRMAVLVWSSSLHGWSRSGLLVLRLLLVDLGCGSSSCTSLDRLHALCHITHGRLDCRVHALDVFP